MKPHVLISLGIVLLFSPQILIAQDLSEWRGELRTGLSAETGLLDSWPEEGPALAWQNLDLPKGYSSISFGEKFIYVTGGYDHGGFMLELSEEGNDVSVLWYDPVLDVHLGGVVLVDGYIYGSSWINNSNGNWVCLDWESGQVMYEEHWSCKGSVISAEGLLYICEEKRGNVGLLRPNPEKFDLISTFRVQEGSGPHWAHPAIHEGKLYLRHGNALMAYHISR